MKRGTAFFAGAVAGFLLGSLLMSLFGSDEEEEPRLEDFGVGS